MTDPTPDAGNKEKRRPGPLQTLVGLIIVGLFLVAVTHFIQLITLTWPACGLLAAAALVRLTAQGYGRKHDSALAKAIVSVTFPYLCGFACVTLLQLGFNLARTSADSVSGVELWLIKQSDRIELLSKPTWWEYVGILVLLGAAGVVAPRLRLRSRYAGAAKVVEGVSGVLATVTAFTFVTAVVGDDYVRQAERTFRARLGDKKRERQEMMADTLVNQVVAQSIQRLTPGSVSILAAIEERLHPAAAGRRPTDAMLDLELGEEVGSVGKAAQVEVEEPPPAAAEAHGEELLREPAEEDRRLAEARRANQEAKEAVNGALDRVADRASGAARDDVRKLVEHLIGDHLGPLLTASLDLTDSLTSEYMSERREPLMKKANAFFDRMVDRIGRLGPPAAAAREVRTRLRSDALDEAVRIEDRKPGNEEFERLGAGLFSKDLSRPVDKTGVLTDAIDVAVDLTPGAKGVDWGRALPPAALPGDAPSGPSPKARFDDPQLERVFEGVAPYHAVLQERMVEIEKSAAARMAAEKLSEREHERAGAEPHGVP